MFPGVTPWQINEDFTAEQVRRLRGAWAGFQKKQSAASEPENETGIEEFAAMFNG